MARLASALVSTFLVNVEQRARDQDPAGLGLARANAEAAGLVPTASAALDILLRRHIIAARRTILSDPAEAGFETQRLCVGFVDLVGSTALAQRLPTRELGAVLTTFENLVADLVTANSGQVVKLIGDEVLYTTRDESSACTIGLRLADTLARHAVIPPVRVGIASGEVLMRDGDVFGPVVNLAARAVKVAPPGQMVVPRSVATTAGIDAESLGQHELKGIPEGIELCRLTVR
jgi:adenylate cyclase